MSLKEKPRLDKDALNQIAGITGIGWTASVLGYLTTVIGYGNTVVTRIVADPQSLLYLGGALFVATLGLDRLKERLVDEESD